MQQEISSLKELSKGYLLSQEELDVVRTVEIEEKSIDSDGYLKIKLSLLRNGKIYALTLNNGEFCHSSDIKVRTHATIVDTVLMEYSSSISYRISECICAKASNTEFRITLYSHINKELAQQCMEKLLTFVNPCYDPEKLSGLGV